MVALLLIVAPLLDVEFQLDVESAKQYAREMLAENDSLAKELLGSLKVGGLLLIAVLANLVLVPVVFFYLLRDWHVRVARVDQLVPRQVHEKVRTIAREVDAVLAEWLRGQMLVIALMSVYYVVALSLTGLKVALPIGIITGLAVIVPYVGIVVGLALATAAAAVQFESLSGVLWVWLAIGIGQALEGMVVTPRLVGERIGLHPVVVIFALLALPASAALLVGLRHLRVAYMAGPLYGRS